jgi:RHS repeat-associated protein
MKYKQIFTLVASLTSTAFAAFQAPLPEFKNEKQLADWRAEKASESASKNYKADESAFYTGKPYLASSGDYAFKYRSYSPELARWTSEDPSGFPDGANHLLYVNNMSINCIDRMGLDIWQITNSNAVSGAGHTAMISGSGSNFQLQSYGSGFSGSASSSPSSSNGLTTQNYSSAQAALNAAASQGYNGFNRWNTTPEQDSAARSGFASNANSAPYSVGTHNCADAVSAGLEAAGVNFERGSNIPNQSHTANKNVADFTGVLTKPE